mgnify:FL=1
MVNNESVVTTEVVVEPKKEETIEMENRKIVYRFIKRIIDIIGGLAGIVLLIPMTIVLYLISIFSKENKGPIFYEQLRVGKNGKYFRIYKFRTMIIGADKILKKYLEENEEARIEFEKNQKLEYDPRITKLGKILRKTSLDEFPQFINVLKGDMSLIGPRPLVEGELDAHNGNHKLYESVKPGITGYWGVNGRSNTTYEERLELEYYYAKNFSFWLDTKIFFKTIISIVKREGAK